MATITGTDVRELRKAHRLSRQELGTILGVAGVTIEKWEQNGAKPVRSKYHSKLLELGGVGAAGIGAGFLAAPALLPIAGVLGLGALGVAALVSDAELERASTTISKLKLLAPTERETMLRLLLKMHGPRYEHASDGESQ